MSAMGIRPTGTQLHESLNLHANTVYGILGLLSLTTSDFIVLITGREFHGDILGNEVFRATDFKVLPLAASPSIQHPVESHLLALIRMHLFGGTFWFSYSWDLTRRIQAHRLPCDQDVGKTLWQTADDRFFWNKYVRGRFCIVSQLGRFILPVIYGTFDICDTSIKSRPFRFALISRRSRYRAGTRYFTRGIDEEGHVANFNETEQIVIVGDSSAQKQGDTPSIFSFVQTRGSVPVFWAEINNLRYKPDLQIMDLQNTILALRRHLEDQITNYGSQHIVNLVRQKGYEKPVKDAFERYINEINAPEVHYDYFDFHEECKKRNRIDLLINKIKGDLINKGYFHDGAPTTAPRQLQTGVVRTNCMDNLDRTNVVQSAIAKWTLTQQLRAEGILLESETVDDFQAFLNKYRNMWADHADSISRAYSGTGALKTDFTRTGKRTFKGLFQDGVNSCMRYLKNNYFDGARQDAFDVFTGSWVPSKGSGLSLLVDSRPFVVRSMPYIFSFSIFMVFAGLTLPRASDYSLIYYFSIWVSLILLSLSYIFMHGVEYVSWPRLNPQTEAIYYNGPGFRSGRKGLGRLGIPGDVLANDVKRKRANSRLEEVEMGSIKKRVD
ncbi:hypothetical protein K439DRAFT_1646925 [Ramaria rubella]|nr:hypothetical protein K439DRAFT_1646925 [Ramaria rubella]